MRINRTNVGIRTNSHTSEWKTATDRKLNPDHPQPLRDRITKLNLFKIKFQVHRLEINKYICLQNEAEDTKVVEMTTNIKAPKHQ